MRARIVTALAVAVLGAPALTAADEHWSLRSANPSMQGDGTAVFTRGVVARWGEHLVLADAAKVATTGDELYATGHVLYRRPGLRIAAARLGLRPQARTGQAWEVVGDVTTGERTFHLEAATVELTADTVVFRDVVVNAGYGGALSFHAPRVTVFLREPPPGQENDETARVRGIEMLGPNGRISGLPVFWLPWMYRDLRQGYPWSRVRFGQSGRLGTWGRLWTGSDLPEVAGWRTGLDGRVDAHSRTGRGGGVRGYWAHDTWGRGRAEWYGLRTETIRGGADDREALGDRAASTFDAAHQVDLGAGALAGRWVQVPDGDPVAGAPANGEIPPDLRFLADYMPEELASRPLPRRSAIGVYANRHVAFAVDLERRHHPYLDQTERWHGEQVAVAPIDVVGPLHLGGNAWAEDLRQVRRDTAANRFRFDGFAAAGHWLPSGFGVEGDAGVRGLDYHRGTIAGAAQTDAARRVQYADGYAKLRLEESYDGFRHAVIPRIGIQLISAGIGDALPDYGFGDARDKLEEDKRFGVLGVDTAMVSDRTLFRGDVTSRWALREDERVFQDADGTTRIGANRLVDVAVHADGSPLPGWTLTVDGLYDARPRAWDNFNGTTNYQAASWLAVYETSTYVATPYSWTHNPGIGLIAHRYRLDTIATLRTDGDAIDAWRWTLLRRMVDGELRLGFEIDRDADGRLFDRRISLGFTLLGTSENTGPNMSLGLGK